MPRAVLPTGVELEYVTTGDPADPAVLAVSGYDSQLVSWQDGLVERIAAHGLFVIRFDNRDVGLSTKFDGRLVDTAAVMAAAAAGEPLPPVPYTLSDMAADGIGLLDHLGVERAHVIGRSMGGMIVQMMAIEHPDRVASVVSIMSTTGARDVGQATPDARVALMAPAPTDRDEYVNSLTGLTWASRRHPDPDWLRELAALQYDRCFYPEGATRQLAAVVATGDRTDRLRRLDVPFLVIHGRDDTLIAPSGGEATAAAVPGASYLLLNDMGHDTPRPLWPMFAEAIAGHVRLADGAG
jgi:pimeloyl-ACP methyl ester carboxylesterase